MVNGLMYFLYSVIDGDNPDNDRACWAEDLFVADD
jgi:hypothetical protein